MEMLITAWNIVLPCRSSHRMWVHPHMAGYFAANEEVALAA
jgi:hypothetical protein